MGLLEKMAADRGRKSMVLGGGQGFVEPPFWAGDEFRQGLWGSGSWKADREVIENDFEGYIHGAYKANGIVFACVLARMLAFSEARFQWQGFSDTNGRPGDLFGTRELALLEKPWQNGTTGELLAHMEQDVSLAGNFYATIADDAGRLGKAATGVGRRISRVRPDWVTIVMGSRSGNPYALDTRVIGYLYRPPLYQGDQIETLLLPGDVCHYSPIPDPEARFRGMSWLTPVLREISADKAATKHKLKFFENGASLNAVATLDKDVDGDSFQRFVELFREQHQGVDNAYKTLFLGGGADVKVIGADLHQIDFKATQGAGETRIASAAGVPPVWVGFSEGLQGSSLNAGNFAQARRKFADGCIRPLWRIAAASLQSLVTPPAGTDLAPDVRNVAFLREDRGDVADIQQKQAMTIASLVREGYTHGSVVAALSAEDWSLLDHTGLYSVQLQPANSVRPSSNGSMPVPVLS